MYLSTVKTALFLDQISDHLSYSMWPIAIRIMKFGFMNICRHQFCEFSENQSFKDTYICDHRFYQYSVLLDISLQ